MSIERPHKGSTLTFLALAGILALLALIALSSSNVPRAGAAVSPTFTVTDSDDTSDASIGNGICANGAGECTLRAAIEEANSASHTGSITINFNITSDDGGTCTIPVTPAAPCIIDLDSSLPDIGNPNPGTTINIDGAAGWTGASTACNSVTAFAVGNYCVAVDGDGTAGNIFFIATGSDGNRIAGLNIRDGTGDGVHIHGASNTIENNRIGTSFDGTSDEGNGDDGVDFDDDGAIGNIIRNNLISGNNSDGVEIGEGSGNFIRGNRIGTNAAGTASLANDGSGVRIITSSNTIGGTTVADRNLISGNGTGAGNEGVRLESPASLNTILGNYIGTNATGLLAIPNADDGVQIDPDANSNTIGGTTGVTLGGACTGACNLISGNTNNGVDMFDNSLNVVSGNFIGANVNGTAALGNGTGSGSDGLWLDGVTDTTIGGATASARNLISGNGDDGIDLHSTVCCILATNNVIQNNYIGVTTSGNSALGNAGNGVHDTADNTDILDNVISANGNDGINLNSSTFAVIQRNKLGVGANGTTALGNYDDGIGVHTGTDYFFGSPALNNLIGGVPSGEGGNGSADMNIIANNGTGSGSGDGVNVNGFCCGGAYSNAVRINSIYQNESQPMDLSNDGGLTNCPFPPADQNGGNGSNDNRDCPAITGITFNAGPNNHTVGVAVNPAEYPVGSHVDVYKATTNTVGGTPGVDPKTYLGTATISGAGLFHSTVVATGSVNVCGLAPGDILTANATDTTGVGNSSEYLDPASNAEAIVASGVSTCAPGGGSASLTVHKNFTDSNISSVSISVSCTGGATPDSSPKPASDNPDIPAVFTITIPSGTVNCSATEGAAPVGYAKNEANCTNVSVPVGGNVSCTITNTPVASGGTASFTVYKDFVPNNGAPVTVSVSCVGGTAAPPSQLVTEAAPGVFTVTIVSGSATCSASEGAAPAGYTQNQGACQNVVMTPGNSYACTIVNTLIPPASATLNVSKDFSDNNGASVTISVTCTNATANGPFSATETTLASFTITSIGGGNTCTATETVPTGYTANQTGCATVPIAAGNVTGCTIVNTLNTATFTVHKDFSDSNTSTVSITVTCTGGAAPAASPLTAKDNPDAPAVFTINAVPTGGTTCTATEGTAPSGYTKNETACANVAIAVGGSVSCTITNTAGRLQGDVDCDGAVTTQDAIKILLYIAGQPYSQQPGCPAIGALYLTHLWGDVDCSGTITVQDAIKILLYIAGQPYSQGVGCTPIGQAITS